MKGRLFLQIFLLVFAIIMLGAVTFAACSLFRMRTEETPDVALAYTSAAQTIIAQVTQDAGSTAVAQLTQIAIATSIPTFQLPGTPTNTFWVPTATSVQPSPTFYPPPTATQPWPTPKPPTAIPPTAIPCNSATFIGDVTIPDGTILPPNTRFTKIWRLRNDGSCFWDSSYQLTFSSGTAMTGATVISLPGVIRPGQEVDLAIDMLSPDRSGTFQSNWYLRDNRGQLFGVGAGGSQPIWAKIVVPPKPTPNPKYAYDFTAFYCYAEWRSQAGLIGCNNPSSSAKGSVIYTNQPQLENRTENEPGLWVRPDKSQTGYLTGLYPPYKVQASDHFITEISCQKGSTGCNLTFRLDYRLGDGTIKNLASWNETHNGKTRVIDLDLAPLNGQTVQFMLVIMNNGNPNQANGIWFVPSIRNNPPTLTPVPPTKTLTPTPSPTQTQTYTPTPSPTLPIIYPPPP